MISLFFSSKVNITNSYAQSVAVNLTCTNPMRITIVYAWYGALACMSCNCSYCNCTAMTVTSTVSANCTGRTSCAFSAGDTFYGDPCYGYAKSSQVTYFCS